MLKAGSKCSVFNKTRKKGTKSTLKTENSAEDTCDRLTRPDNEHKHGV